MSGNRKAAEDLIIKYVEKISGSKENTAIYKSYFAAMSDDDFDRYIKRLEQEQERLFIVVPNLSKKTRLSVERNLEIAKELGHDFFQRIWMTDEDTGMKYLTPVRYMVVDLPVRRQAQLLVKKISIPEDNKSTDMLSGQPTGKSKGGKISYPETQVLAALGLDSSLTELLKYRGGDTIGFDQMNSVIGKTGGVSMQAIEPFSGVPQSTITLKTILTSMHLGTTL